MPALLAVAGQESLMVQYGVRFRDGSVRHPWNGRTQRQRAEEEHAPHLVLVSRDGPDAPWREVTEPVPFTGTLPHTVTMPDGSAHGCSCEIGADHAQQYSTLMVWTIYAQPADYPTVPFVLRGWLISKEGLADSGAIGFADTLEQARNMLPPALTRLPRDDDDDGPIVESWI
jgi:hypothetical protein